MMHLVGRSLMVRQQVQRDS